MMMRIDIKDDTAYANAERYCLGLQHGAESSTGAEGTLESVRTIVDAVRDRGDAAVAEFTRQFDGVSLTPDEFELTEDEIARAAERVDPELLAALERAHENIRTFHSKFLRESWEETSPDGTVLGQRITPIEKVGVYVPGGKAFYPSSVLMNIVPARVAGVSEIVMVSPPSCEGSIHPVVLAAARLAGATRVFRIGGAQAVAALAYGAEHVPTVLKITGPGNIYVTLAKRLVQGACDIDSEAGPSEVVVVADAAADPRFVAAELLAQAEHDEEARVILIATDAGLADRVADTIEKEIAGLLRTEIIQAALEGQGAIIVTRTIEEAARLTDLVAPEHLSIQTESPRDVLDLIPNAGAAMLGPMTPVPVGDYYAGPNHILPTGRRARFSSPLSAEDFRKVTSVLSYSKERLKNDANDIIRLANAEELPAHARAVEVRL